MQSRIFENINNFGIINVGVKVISFINAGLNERIFEKICVSD